MKKFILTFSLISIILTCAILLTGCSNTPDNSTVDKSTQEWISPDGVHYWYWGNYNNSGLTYVLAPRYDHEGNLVIEINEPKEPDWDLINTKP